jgi:hypothetical protein
MKYNKMIKYDTGTTRYRFSTGKVQAPTQCTGTPLYRFLPQYRILTQYTGTPLCRFLPQYRILTQYTGTPLYRFLPQ